ncbi:MAG TPA: hypothetical protein VFJ52_00445 [Terriglobia bacterium]|nr:hypothetical protein [Terriglobia bacterium]
MSPENPSDRSPAASPAGPGKGSLIALAVTLGLLAVLVASLYPARSKLKPAPLQVYAPGCLKLRRTFIATNITEVPDLSRSALPARAQTRALFRINMESCSCGCNHSVADCRLTNPSCQASRNLLQQEVEQAAKSGSQEQAAGQDQQKVSE